MVWVLILNYVCVDSGDFTTTVIGVYKNFKDAHQRLMVESNNIREEMSYVDLEEEETDMSLSIYEKDEYPSFHCDLIIESKDIQ